MKKRSESLDALRGFAILAMVMSSSIAFGILPAWMYHAQVPPPAHSFNPNLPGITWVDLVFPFFLFSMGAALPLSLAKKTREASPLQVIWFILQRGILLAFFSIFTMHIRAYINYDAGVGKWLLAIGAFVLIHLMFVKWPDYMSTKVALALKFAAFACAIFILTQLTFKDGSGFKLTRIDIIIMVLANMAVFGSAAWVLTQGNMWARILILPFIMGIFLSGAVADSWTQKVFNWTPLPGIYSFYYLKYLFIIIPGTIAGEWLQHFMKQSGEPKNLPAGVSYFLAFLSFALIVINLAGLFERLLVANLITSLVIVLASIIAAKKITKETGDVIYEKFVKAGGYLLLLGLVFESYQGGIKKDSSTYSYYFVTSGLAFYFLCGLLLLERMNKLTAPIRYLAANGKNPMVAYVAGNLIVLPILHITGGDKLMHMMDNNVWTGFLEGVIFTGIVSLITVLFVRLKFFWKT